MTKSKFSQNLMDLRTQHNFSQEKLALKLAVTRQTISKWENGDSVPDLNNLLKMSKIFNISLDQLVSSNQVIKIKNIFEKVSAMKPEEDESDKDWHQNHRWREWRYGQINNGWEFLARYYWVLFSLIGSIGWLVFEFNGKHF